MSQQENPQYKPDDVVWAKIDSFWWPANVVDYEQLSDEIKQEARLRKIPLISVKYFDEDKYDFFHNYNNIYPYNCEKKDDFIKKGIDKKNSLKDIFCRDVCTAEKLTGGDLNILSDPKYSPEKKVNITDIFGKKKPTPKGKRGKRSSKGLDSASASPKTPSSDIVMHPRFIGHDSDFQVRVLMQTPEKKDNTNDEKYKCQNCSFSSPRIDVFLLHAKVHSNRGPNDVKSPKKAKQRSPRKPRNSTSGTPRSRGGGKAAKPADKEEVVKSSSIPTITNNDEKQDTGKFVKNNIVSEWSDDEENEENKSIASPKVVEADKNESCFDLFKADEAKPKSETPPVVRKPNQRKRKSKKSIDDADDDDDDDNATAVDTNDVSKVSEAETNDVQSNIDEIDKLMELTSVPSLPELPESDSSKEDKSSAEKATSVATKLTNPKKRFVKSFEDFEMSLRNEKEKLEKEKQKEEITPTVDENKTDLAENDQVIEKQEENEEEEEEEVKKVDDSVLEENASENKAIAAIEVIEDVEDKPKDVETRKTRRSTRLDKTKSDNNEKDLDVVDKQADDKVDVVTTRRSTKKDKLFDRLRAESPLKDVKSMKRGRSPRKDIKSPRRDDTKSPRREDIKSPRRDVKSPKRDEIKSPKKEEIKSPRRDEIKSPKRDETAISKKDEIKSPKKDDVKITKKDDIKSPRREEIKSPRREDIKSPKREQIKSPKSDIKSPSREEVKSPRKDEMKSPKREEIKSPKREEMKSPKMEDADMSMHEEMKSPKHEEIKSPRRESLRSPRKEEIKSPKYEAIKTPPREEIADEEAIIPNVDDIDVAKTAEMKSPIREGLRSPIKENIKSPKHETLKSPKHEILKSPKREILKSPRREDVKRKEEMKSPKREENARAIRMELRNSRKEPLKEESGYGKKAKLQLKNKTEIEKERAQEAGKIIANKIIEEFSDGETEDEEEIVQEKEIPKFSKLKSKLMNKLCEPEPEKSIRKSTENTDQQQQENNKKTTDDVVLGMTTKSSKQLSLQSQEISIEKSTDKIEVTVNKEAANVNSITQDILDSFEEEYEPIEKEDVEKELDIALKVPEGEENLQEQPMDIEESAGTTIHENDDLLFKNKEEIMVEEESSLSALAALNSFEPVEEKLEANIDRNIHVVSESDLADRQVEIAKIPIIEEGTVKATTIASFSVDFANIDDAFDTTTPHKPLLDIDDGVDEKHARVVVEAIKEKLEAEPTNTIEAEMAKMNEPTTNIIENAAPVAQQAPVHQENTSKLLEILTDHPKLTKAKPPTTTTTTTAHTLMKVQTKPATDVLTRVATQTTQKPKLYIRQTASTSKSSGGKSIILSDKLVKAAPPTSGIVSVKKMKRPIDDFEDIDTYVIQKPKKPAIASEMKADAMKIVNKKALMSKSKPTILGHTIITPGGEVIQPAINKTSQSQQSDDNVFDIDSMPIVLDDQILTPENIEKMPIMIQGSDSSKVSSSSSSSSSSSATQLRKVQPSQVKLLNKTPNTTTPTMTAVKPQLPQNKTFLKTIKGGKVYHSSAHTLLKHSPTIIQSKKPGKFVIIPSEASAPTGSKYTVGKRITKKPPTIIQGTNKVQNVVQESSGNKVMYVTNPQGQQTRVLLTPAKQQNLIAYQTTMKKGTMKTTLVNKSPNIISQTIINAKGQITTTNQPVYTSTGSSLTQIKKPLLSKNKIIGQKVIVQSANQVKPQGRTIIIKNPQGQTLKRITSNDDIPLDQQVAQQLDAINRASGAKLQQSALKQTSISGTPTTTKKFIRRAGVTDNTKLAIQNKAQMILNTSTTTTTKTSVPPLAPISPAKRADVPQRITKTVQQHKLTAPKAAAASAAASNVIAAAVAAPPPAAPVPVPSVPSEVSDNAEKQDEPKRAPHQLVIQDALGNQTTITEGQILALPSETVDGQPQSYMLVTLDETGNLTPLNNEALMSLDPNLNLGGDLSNMVLQIDQGQPSTEPSTAAAAVATTASTETTKIPENILEEQVVKKTVEAPAAPVPPIKEIPELPPQETILEPEAIASTTLPTETSDEQQAAIDPNQMQAVACSINNGDTNQQLIITGDPISTQKFLESLSEGNADLANLLAGHEGNILIHTDGQQILINTDADNQMLLGLNSDETTALDASVGGGGGGESSGNPIFASQPSKNQDILAAALADTDFQQEQAAIVPASNKVTPQTQLSPSTGGLYPMSVNNVLETSTMNAPIMTPLEVPSLNNKKINDEADILQPCAKNVDLPITITDPNISQTVAHQQVSTLLANDIHTNLELPLAIQDVVAAVTSAELNSPSFGGYSLPNLDDAVDVQKQFASSISMPLLTEEEPDEVASTSTAAAAPPAASTTSTITDKTTTTTTNDDLTAALVETTTTTTTKHDDHMEKMESQKSDEFLLTTTALCLSNQMCSSLSEPPPDMFDFAMEQNYLKQQQQQIDATTHHVAEEEETQQMFAANDDDAKVDVDVDNFATLTSSINKTDAVLELGGGATNSDSPSTSVDSLEIPVQGDIVTDINLDETNESTTTLTTTSTTTDTTTLVSKRSMEDNDATDESESKKCKLD